MATFYIFAHLCSAGLGGRRPGSQLAAAGRCAVTRHAASRTLPWARGRTERQHCNSSDHLGPPTGSRGPRRLAAGGRSNVPASDEDRAGGSAPGHSLFSLLLRGAAPGTGHGEAAAPAWDQGRGGGPGFLHGPQFLHL